LIVDHFECPLISVILADFRQKRKPVTTSGYRLTAEMF
jgi:hypothetical protein